MYFFTSDEHINHINIIKYCKRPFKDIQEMEKVLVYNHNNVVRAKDTVIHAGDLTLGKKEVAANYIKQLNGNHIFLKGSHDHWLGNGSYIWTKMIDNQYVVVCHYCMKTWPRSHYYSWQLFGHSHGRLILTPSEAMCQYDIGVDNNNFYPASFDQIRNIFNNNIL